MTSGMTTGAARAKIGLKQLPAPKSAGQAVGAKTGASDLGVQRVVIGTDAGCLIPTGRFREVPDQPAGRARAAGQATDMIITLEEVAAYNEAYVTAKNNANPVVQGMSDARFTAVMSAAGRALDTAGTTIAAIISSNNQRAIEELRENTRLRIAELNRGTQTATTTQQSTDLSTLLAILNAQNNQSQPWTKIAAGVAAVAVIGLGAYAIQRSTRRKNPVMTRGKTRKFVKPADVLHEMELGFSVTGKTSSGKRRRRGRK